VTNVDAVELRDLKWAVAHVARSKGTRLFLRKHVAREGLEHERWSRCQQDAICLRRSEVAVIALNRSYLDGKCWLERQKVLRNGADTAHVKHQLRADSNLLDEIQKRSDLRRREVARGMIGIERIEFFRPFRQDLNKLASRQ
jgi:hypothetical protein